MKQLVNQVPKAWQFVLCAAVLAACSKSQPTSMNPGQSSSVTGIEYNVEGNFTLDEYQGQPEAPNMVYIEGGRFTMGSFEEDLMGTRDNLERTVTVASFYMDQTEIGNIHWLEYLLTSVRILPPNFTSPPFPTLRCGVVLSPSTILTKIITFAIPVSDIFR